MRPTGPGGSRELLHLHHSCLQHQPSSRDPSPAPANRNLEILHITTITLHREATLLCNLVCFSLLSAHLLVSHSSLTRPSGCLSLSPPLLLAALFHQRWVTLTHSLLGSCFWPASCICQGTQVHQVAVNTLVPCHHFMSSAGYSYVPWVFDAAPGTT
jgi:hypothetical protein